MNPETHRKKVTPAVVLLLLAQLAGVSRAGDQTGKLSDEKKAKIEAAVSTFMASSRVPGISVAVV